MWLPLAWSLNMVNRSMGNEDLYPFVLPPAVLEKMRFIHTVIDEITDLVSLQLVASHLAEPNRRERPCVGEHGGDRRTRGRSRGCRLLNATG